MEWLFTRCADEWAHPSARQHAWRGLALYGVDGSTLRVPDSDENRRQFGGSSGIRGDSAYPLVRIAALMGLRSHLLAAVAFGPYNQSELAYASALWQSVPNDSLTIVDRNYLAAPVLVPLHRNGSNRHWLTRAKTKTVWHVIVGLGPGDELVELETSPESLQKDPSLPRRYRARAIRYQRKGFQPSLAGDDRKAAPLLTQGSRPPCSCRQLSRNRAISCSVTVCAGELGVVRRCSGDGKAKSI
jgi:hypothetical protein